MRSADIAQLNELERRLLEASFDPDNDERKTWRIVVDSLVMAVIIISLAVWSAPMILVVIVTLTYLLVATLEKASWQRQLLGYRTVVQKLVHRVESLEGVPLRTEYHRAFAPSSSSAPRARPDEHTSRRAGAVCTSASRFSEPTESSLPLNEVGQRAWVCGGTTRR